MVARCRLPPPAELPQRPHRHVGEVAPMPDAVTLARLEGNMMGKVLALATHEARTVRRLSACPRFRLASAGECDNVLYNTL
jgi:hypothetical protein